MIQKSTRIALLLVMATNVVIVLLFLGLFPIGAAVLHAGDGPGVELACRPSFLWPWWVLAGIGVVESYVRGAFDIIHLPRRQRAVLVASSFVVAAGLFFSRAGFGTIPTALDVAARVCLPAGLVFGLAWVNSMAACRRLN